MGGVAVKPVSLWELKGRRALGLRLRQLRLESRLKFKEVCHRANIESSTLNYLEAGERTPSIPVLRRISRVYGIDPVELFELLVKPEVNEPVRAERRAASE